MWYFPVQYCYYSVTTLLSVLLLRTIGFSRCQRSYHVLSFSKVLQQTHCDSVETVVRKRRLLVAGAGAKEHNGQLPRRVMFGRGGTEARQAREDLAGLRIGRPQGFPSHQRLY